ncbi:hypothetical protein [Sphingosinicella sp. YJ22]|uniref:hypothetical protein n=1 Tax=Sphingosinicella sp. YJ22 TaxID=1104780 RepID=UPI00140B5B92|nr:hypothetical protein [Sphingosinicella sp. YJ22]
MAFGKVTLGVTAALALIVSACGAPAPANEAVTNNIALAPEDVLAESNASIIAGGNGAVTDVSPPAGNETSAPAEASTTIPARFHGRWDASREACGRASSGLRLTVAASSLRFYESVGEVTAVREMGSSVAVDLRTTGEGETRTETRTLRLGGDGRLVVESGGTSATRVRCPT